MKAEEADMLKYTFSDGNGTIFAFWGPLGTPLRDLLGRLEGLLGRLEAILGVLDDLSASRGSLGPSGRPLGALLDRFGALLGSEKEFRHP